jgi:hypothetical protein
MPDGAEDERGVLLQTLQYQRASVLAIVEGPWLVLSLIWATLRAHRSID